MTERRRIGTAAGRRCRARSAVAVRQPSPHAACTRCADQGWSADLGSTPTCPRPCPPCPTPVERRRPRDLSSAGAAAASAAGCSPSSPSGCSPCRRRPAPPSRVRPATPSTGTSGPRRRTPPASPSASRASTPRPTAGPTTSACSRSTGELGLDPRRVRLHVRGPQGPVQERSGRQGDPGPGRLAGLDLLAQGLTAVV